MSAASPDDDLAETSRDVGLVTVRYWASARAAAGRDGESVPIESAGTLAELIGSLAGRHPGGAFEERLRACAVLVGSRPVGSRDPADVALAAGDRVEFLPPFAGG